MGKKTYFGELLELYSEQAMYLPSLKLIACFLLFVKNCISTVPIIKQLKIINLNIYITELLCLTLFHKQHPVSFGICVLARCHRASSCTYLFFHQLFQYNSAIQMPQHHPNIGLGTSSLS